MEALAYYDGKIGTPEELMVPFNDRVLFFGDGVYDATGGANGKVHLMQDLLDRFYTSAKALDIHIPMPKEELGRLLTDLLAKVDMASVVDTLSSTQDQIKTLDKKINSAKSDTASTSVTTSVGGRVK